MDESQYCPLCEQSATRIEILSAGMVSAIKQRDEAIAKVSALEAERGQSQYCSMCNELALQNQAMRDALVVVRDDLELRMKLSDDDSLNISNSALDILCDAIDLPDLSTDIIKKHGDRDA